MPPGYVRTIRAEIFYEYAKPISRSAFGGMIDCAFVASRFKAVTLWPLRSLFSHPLLLT